MVSRSETPLSAAAHQVLSDQTNCLSCHVAGKVGALPDDHATRTSSECLLCHASPATETPIGLRLGLRRD
jgi:hypothetical protein